MRRLKIGDAALVGRDAESAVLRELIAGGGSAVVLSSSSSPSSAAVGEDDPRHHHNNGERGGLSSPPPSSDEYPSKCCLVHGAAGSGKTSLVQRAAVDAAAAAAVATRGTRRKSRCGHDRESGSDNCNDRESHSFIFVSGKFDQYKDYNAPYSEIVSAFDGIISSSSSVAAGAVRREEEEEEQQQQKLLRERVRACLATEARILTRLVPSFAGLFENSDVVGGGGGDGAEEEETGEKRRRQNQTKSKTPNNHSGGGTTGDCGGADDGSGGGGDDDDAILTLAAERLVVAFRVFLREFCSPETPVVLFIDDLQVTTERLMGLLLAAVYVSAEGRTFVPSRLYARLTLPCTLFLFAPVRVSDYSGATRTRADYSGK